MADRGLLCVHPHPDDEALATGGVLARAADKGVRTAVVTCTWAEGTRRAHELARALDILGAGEPRLLGYADARRAESAPGAARFVDAPFDEAVGRVVAQIREIRPDVVVTYDGYGVTGHEDHIHTHRVTLAAVEAAGYDQLYPEAGQPWRPRALALVTLPRERARAFWSQVFGGKAGSEPVLPGVPEDQINAVVDVSAWFDRKWAAIRAHDSEAQRGSGPAKFARLPEPQLRQVLGTETFIVRSLLPGAPTDDLLVPSR